MPFASVTDWAIYHATYWAAFHATTFGWGFRATGRHHLPRTGPALVLANHQSQFDPLLLGLAAVRPLRFVARSTLFDNPVVGRFIRYFGAVPIDRGFGREGLHAALGLLDRGEAVVMFPEGERTHTGAIQPLKPGVSLLLRRLACPVVPVGIAGAYQAWPRTRLLPTPDPLLLPSEGRSLAVAIGEPIPASHFHHRDRDAMVAEVDTAIRRAYAAAERLRRKPRFSASSWPGPSPGGSGTPPNPSVPS